MKRSRLGRPQLKAQGMLPSTAATSMNDHTQSNGIGTSELRWVKGGGTCLHVPHHQPGFWAVTA